MERTPIMPARELEPARQRRRRIAPLPRDQRWRSRQRHVRDQIAQIVAAPMWFRRLESMFGLPVHSGTGNFHGNVLVANFSCGLTRGDARERAYL